MAGIGSSGEHLIPCVKINDLISSSVAGAKTLSKEPLYSLLSEIGEDTGGKDFLISLIFCLK